MTTAENLPLEIYVEIFQSLHNPYSKRDIIICSEVCWLWSRAVNDFKFQQIKFDGAKVLKWRKSFAQDQDEHPHIRHGHFVKELEIHHDGDYFGHEADSDDDVEDMFTKDELTQLFKKFPNLKIFNIANSINTRFYLEYLQDIDNSQQLTKLEEIVAYESDETPEEYQALAFQTSLNFRSTLIRLNVPYHNRRLYTIDRKSGDGLHFLPTFTKLKHLGLCNTCGPNITIFKVQDTFPKLISFQFKTSFSVPLMTKPSPPFSFVQSLKMESPKLLVV